jgi:hypothetical protein
MKKILLLLCLFIACTNLFAQKVKYKKDQILIDDQAVAVLEKISNGAMQPANFSLKTLDNSEILVAQIQNLTTTDGYFNYNIVFVKSGNKGEVRVAAINAGERLAKIFIENELIKDNAPSEEAERRFLLLYPSKEADNNKQAIQQVVNVFNGEQPKPLRYETVSRPTSGIIFVDAKGSVSESNTEIGTIQSQRDMQMGKFKTSLTIALPNKTQIAEAQFEGIDANNTATLVTYRDRLTHQVPINEATYQKDIVTFLTKNGYL